MGLHVLNCWFKAGASAGFVAKHRAAKHGEIEKILGSLGLTANNSTKLHLVAGRKLNQNGPGAGNGGTRQDIGPKFSAGIQVQAAPCFVDVAQII